jgi:O-succinylbenzoic acid--CoA ligase
MKFHKDFRLNECSFQTVDDVLIFSKGVSTDVHLFLKSWFDTSDFIKVHTSGSTGKPKEIFLKKSFMVNSALATGKYFSLEENTNALLCLSADYIAGKMMLVRALILGWSLDVVKTNSNPLKFVEKHYDFSAMVPLQLANSIPDLFKVRKLIVGGGVVSNNLKRKLNNISTEVYATYGMTETITHIAIKKLNYFSEKGNYFTLLPNVSISLDSRYCLVINAPLVSDGAVVTNDLVNIINENQFEWKGRYDSIINSGGIKLIPEQIEEILSKKIEERFFVSSVVDEVLGEKLVLIVEREGVAIENKEGIETFLEGLELDKYQLPKIIYFMEKFMETETSKIHRNNTKQLLKLN